MLAETGSPLRVKEMVRAGVMLISTMLSHSGAPRSGEPGIHNQWPRVMDSGLAPSARPGMTGQSNYLASCLLKWAILLRPQRPQHGFRVERQFRQPHADGVVDGVADGRRHAEGRDLADALAAERPIGLIGVDGLVLECHRQVVDAGDLVVCQRRIGDLAAVEMHLLEHGEAELHSGGAGKLRPAGLRIYRLSHLPDI